MMMEKSSDKFKKIVLQARILDKQVSLEFCILWHTKSEYVHPIWDRTDEG